MSSDSRDNRGMPDDQAPTFERARSDLKIASELDPENQPMLLATILLGRYGGDKAQAYAAATASAVALTHLGEPEIAAAYAAAARWMLERRWAPRTNTTRVNQKPCPSCNHPLSAISAITEGEARGPQPGDPIACIRCGAVMTVENGELRGFTPTEMAELTADQEAMDDLAQMVGRIHFLRHMQN